MDNYINREPGNQDAFQNVPPYNENMNAGMNPDMNPNMNAGMNQYGGYYNPAANRRNDGVSARRFELFGIPTMIYAILYSVFMYKNFSSVCSIPMAVMTVIFMSICLSRYDYNYVTPDNGIRDMKASFGKQKKLVLHYAGIILLGISVCFTADTFIIFMDNMGIILLVITALLRYFYGGSNLGFIRYGLACLDIFASPLSGIHCFHSDYKLYHKGNEHKKNNVMFYVLIGIVIAIPLLYVIIGLLASADEIFGDVITTILGQIFISWDMLWFVVFTVIILYYVYGLIVQTPVIRKYVRLAKQGTNEPIIAITTTVMLTLVYLLFSFIQILYLFTSNMTLPNHLSYAEYARQGFFQLLFVSFFNVVLVLVCRGLFRHSRVLNIVLTIMSCCTYIMLASSALRMNMYVEEYGLTYLRLLVYVGLIMIALVLAGVIIRIYSDKFPVVNYALLCIMLIYIPFSFCKPAKLIAENNLKMEVFDEETYEEIDYYYLKRLGPDATPVLCDYIDFIEQQAGTMAVERFVDEYNINTYFEKIIEEYKDHGAGRGFNASRYQAYREAKRYLGKENDI